MMTQIQNAPFWSGRKTGAFSSLLLNKKVPSLNLIRYIYIPHGVHYILVLRHNLLGFHNFTRVLCF